MYNKLLTHALLFECVMFDIESGFDFYHNTKQCPICIISFTYCNTSLFSKTCMTCCWWTYFDDHYWIPEFICWSDICNIQGAKSRTNSTRDSSQTKFKYLEYLSCNSWRYFFSCSIVLGGGVLTMAIIGYWLLS